jgi:fatty-acyl-CoA synthase
MSAPSYSHGTSDTPLLGDTIGLNFERIARRFADRPALVSRHQEVRLTYAQLDAAVDAAASGLLRFGVRAGDRVGIWAPNCAEWVVIQYATAKVGAILVNVNPAYRTHELEYVLRQSGVRLLLSASAFKTSDYAAMIEEVAGGVDTLERTVFVDRPEWAEFCAGEPDREAIAARMAELSFDDPINIQYTSGTTGFPKGATLSHHNILNNGFFVTELLGLTEDDVTCLPVPFYHCFGMVMGNLGTFAHGGNVVIPAPSFEPRATLEAVAAEGVTSLYGVPTMFIAMLGHEDFS